MKVETSYTTKELIKIFRSRLKPGTVDKEYKLWTQQQPCIYNGMMEIICTGRQTCADHVCSGFNGIKSTGLLLVPACKEHNGLAEQFPAMHESQIVEAIILRLKYEESLL